MIYSGLFIALGLAMILGSARINSAIQTIIQAVGIVVTFLAGVTVIHTIHKEETTQLLISPAVTLEKLADSESPDSIFIHVTYFPPSGKIAPIPYVEQLKKLAVHLGACSTVETPVVMNVIGYSSSSQFARNSEMTNKTLAMDRAKAVTDIIVQNAKNPITIVTDSWANSDDVSRRRPINDLVEDHKRKTEMEYLNRAVIVSLTDAGECDPYPRKI